MKKLILFLALLITINVFGQDVNTTVYNSYYHDTLTTTIDTMQIKFQSGFDYYTISVYTTTGTDTINVYSKGEGNFGIWTQKALIDLSTNSVVPQIIITTTPKEYLLQDPSTMWLQIITPDVSASSIFTINAKKGNYAINGSSPINLPFTSGGYGAFTVGVVADTLSGTSVDCVEVEITNNTPGTTLYVGYDASVSPSNGYPLAYRDIWAKKISNLNKIYLIGSSTIDVRYIYNKY